MNSKKWILIGLLPICLLLGFSAGRITHPVEMAIRKARRISPRGDTEKMEALDVLDTASEFIDLALKNGEIQEMRHFISLALAEHLIQREMWYEAEEYLEYSQEILPGDYSVNYDLGVVYASLYNIEQDEVTKLDYLDAAIDCLNVAIEAQPDDANSHYLLGILYYNYGFLNDAMDNFEVVLDQFPQDIPTLLAQARVYYDRGNYEQAKKLYLKLENLLSVDDDRFDTVEENLEIVNEAILEEGGIME